MSSERNPLDLIPLWLEATKDAELPIGMSPDEALQRAAELRDSLRANEATIVPDDVDPSVFHALFEILCESDDEPSVLLGDGSRAYDLLSARSFPDDEVGERESLLADLAFACWRAARQCREPAAVEVWARRLEETCTDDPRAQAMSDRITSIRSGEIDGLALMVTISRLTPIAIESGPSSVRLAAEHLYATVQGTRLEPLDLDEREYCLGEIALIAGTACRVMARWDRAHRWFGLAETHFQQAALAELDLCRLDYQRLALSLEERNLEEVLARSPVCTEAFLRLGMPEGSLKCRFLEGAALAELGRLPRAISVFTEICTEAETLGSPRLVALAANNLVTYFADAGETEKALEYARKALPVLQQLSSRVHLAKLQWSMGDLFRKQGKRAAALEAYRQALADAAELGMRGDVAAIHLVVADFLLEASQEAQAEWEIRAALPIIEEEKMVPEGIAALSLLRESLRRRQIDRHALRDLHDHFKDPPR